jgi:hypothetical protein
MIALVIKEAFLYQGKTDRVGNTPYSVEKEILNEKTIHLGKSSGMITAMYNNVPDKGADMIRIHCYYKN